MSPLLRPTLLALCLGLCLSPTLHAEETPAAEQPASDSAAAKDAEGGEDKSTDKPAEVPRVPLDERTSAEAGALERQLPQTEQQQLQAGDERFLALWKPANAAEATGVVILVPGADETADWPSVIGPLRTKLTNAGWSTLSLTLPDSPAAPLPTAILPQPIVVAPPVDTSAAASQEQDPASADKPAADAAAAPVAEPAPAAPPVDPAVRVFARIEAGIAYAEQQGAQSIVLLGHGDGAYWAALFLAEKKPTQVENLLTVAAHLPAGQQPPLEELIPGLKLATGDFFYKDQASDRSDAVKRLQASKRLAHPSYVQVALKALPGNNDAEQEQLYRRIRGWLDKQLPAKK
ncbi:alpha/beta hydrolase family protein [Aquipseudomonas ullengensis]|uniref:Alpha/beta hydrolase family protein n=1 Tax=Aquipseudomonas ullengensis TaxID=2759166 RepID=A0A7W4QBQ8_9GAMM|nr:alpha/beta hydrolase family protein [Pseudomonas ullengensis]MBB2496725.1 alpha/beta hydrolase family protein [Pseudomonas ullengensis]